MRILNIFGTRKRVILNHFENGYIIMESINDEQYKKLKDEKNAKGQCSFKSDNCCFNSSEYSFDFSNSCLT